MEPNRANNQLTKPPRYCELHKRDECIHQRSKNRGQCHAPAVKGAPACRIHLGRKVAEYKEEVAMQTARELAAQEFGVAVVTTAEDALLDALSRSLGLVLYYQARVKALQPEQLTQGTERITRTRKNPGGPDEVVEDVAVAKTAVNVYVRLLQEAELHHFRVAAKIAELQIEAGRVRLAREQGALMFELLARTLALVNIPVDDPRIVAGVPGIMGELTA